MAYTSKLDFRAGGIIAGQGAVKPGAQIKKAIEELQDKSVTDLTSKAPGLGFEKRGKNTWALVPKSASAADKALIRVADPVGNNGTSGSAEIKYENGQYVLYITFPRVNRTVINGKEPEEAVNDLEERVAALEERVAALENALSTARLALSLAFVGYRLEITGGLHLGERYAQNSGEGVLVTECD